MILSCSKPPQQMTEVLLIGPCLSPTHICGHRPYCGVQTLPSKNCPASTTTKIVSIYSIGINHSFSQTHFILKLKFCKLHKHKCNTVVLLSWWYSPWVPMPPEDTNASPGSGAAIIKGSTIRVNCWSFVAKKGDSCNQQRQSVTSKLVIRSMSLFEKAQSMLNLILIILIITRKVFFCLFCVCVCMCVYVCNL